MSCAINKELGTVGLLKYRDLKIIPIENMEVIVVLFDN
jgi:hypothetical protein